MKEDINLRVILVLGLIFVFSVNTFGPLPLAQAQLPSSAGGEFSLPAPGAKVPLSPEFNPPILKGIKVHNDNPFRFEFILDKGDRPAGELRTEATRLIKYFLASLTIPEKDLWVNLSPYEKNRIVPESFGQTEMGRDLLAEDYMLKQITASLIYPEDGIGKKFWKRIYEQAAKKYGTTNIPVNTFNKVWIVPEKAVVYENAKAGTAYVVESKLKVMLEQDYLALSHSVIARSEATKQSFSNSNALGSQIIREIVIPELTKEVNEGKNFVQLRQVYNSLLLATWYKKKIKDSILARVYADKKKVAGVGYSDSVIARGEATKQSQTNDVEVIYQHYLQAFKKGVYNYIKEDVDPLTQKTIPRRYFSGGIVLDTERTNLEGSKAMVVTHHLGRWLKGALKLGLVGGALWLVSADITPGAFAAVPHHRTAIHHVVRHRTAVPHQQAVVIKPYVRDRSIPEPNPLRIGNPVQVAGSPIQAGNPVQVGNSVEALLGSPLFSAQEWDSFAGEDPLSWRSLTMGSDFIPPPKDATVGVMLAQLHGKESLLPEFAERFKQAAVYLAHRYQESRSQEEQKVITRYYVLGMQLGGEGQGVVPTMEQLLNGQVDPQKTKEIQEWLGIGDSVENGEIERLTALSGDKVRADIITAFEQLTLEDSFDLLREKLQSKYGGDFHGKAGSIQGEIRAIQDILGIINTLKTGSLKGDRDKGATEAFPNKITSTNVANCAGGDRLVVQFLKNTGFTNFWSSFIVTKQGRNHVILEVRLSDGQYYIIDPMVTDNIMDKKEFQQAPQKWLRKRFQQVEVSVSGNNRITKEGAIVDLKRDLGPSPDSYIPRTDNFENIFMAPAEKELGVILYNNLGVVFLSKGKFNEARGYFLRALELSPHPRVSGLNPNSNIIDSVLWGLIRAWVNTGEPEGDLKRVAMYLSTLIEEHPEEASLHAILSEVLKAQGEQKEAEVALKRAIELDSDNSDVKRVLGAINNPDRSKQASLGASQFYSMRVSYSGNNKPSNTGGIDLTSGKIFKVKHDVNGEIKFHISPAQLVQLQNVPGFVPMIISIQPLKSLTSFLGLNQGSVQ